MNILLQSPSLSALKNKNLCFWSIGKYSKNYLNYNNMNTFGTL